MIYASYKKNKSKELKYGIEILVGQAVFQLWIKAVKMLLGSITQKRFLNFDDIFEFLGQFTVRCTYFFQKGVDNFEIEHKTC